MSRESYMQLLRNSDARIARLLDEGFAFETNAFRPGVAASRLASGEAQTAPPRPGSRKDGTMVQRERSPSR